MEAPAVQPQTQSLMRSSAGDYHVTSPDSDQTKRKRQPRNTACQPCATLKMKCVPSSESGKCERCHRMNKDCIAAMPKPRKRRAESNVGHDASPGPGSMDARTTSPVTTAHGVPKKTSKRMSTVGSTADSLPARTDLRYTGSKSFTALFATGLGLDPTQSELLEGIDANAVQNNTTIFRQYTLHFPFIDPNQDGDSVVMITRRPLLTAAICTVTTPAMTDLQVRLSRAIRQSLSTRGVLDGERSTDLLLGLLVYLAWHHQRFGHAQAYRYICLLAGIAADEGIYRRRSPPENTEDLAFIVERDRAFVGCYYLCASLSSTGFHRPSPLRWTDNLRQCGENVARFGSLLSDRSLISIVELLHATEVFEKSSQAPAHLTQSVDHFRELNAKAAQHRLETLRAEHPSLASNRAFTAAAIRIYQRLLGTTNLPATSTLIRCACTIKEYIDDVLNRPPNTLHQLAIVDWTDLLDILMLMARISTPLPSAEGWEAGALTSMLPPEDVLNSVCAHMASAPADDPLAPRNEDLIRWLRRFCESVKSRIVRDRQDQSRPLNGSAIATSGEVPPLPYGAEVKDGPVISMPDAVLDEAFLNNFMRLP